MIIINFDDINKLLTALTTVFGAGFFGTWLKGREDRESGITNRYLTEIERLDKKIDKQNESIKQIEETNSNLVFENYEYRRRNIELEMEVKRLEKRVKQLEFDLEKEKGGE